MGYTRIEPLPGGAAIPIRQTWRMHKGNDGRKRANKRPHAEGGRRSGKPPTPRA